MGDQLQDADRTALAEELAKVQEEFDQLEKKPENANAEVFLKAVRYALDYTEFYNPGDAGKARGLLAVARTRIGALKNGEQPWLKEKRLVVRGYYSPIDGSPQPFGLEIPEDAPDEGAPAWVWLQGRGEKRTDLTFIDERMGKPGQFRPAGTIIVHPWGRYCVGTKNAGERDVLEVRELLLKEGRIDPKRVAIAGFSMGGAGAWLLGAHHTDKWTVMHAGAGFVDVRKFQNLSDEVVSGMPSWQKTLWGQNDVPDYARNLLNIPLVAYSGENDKQRQAAEIMTEVLAKEGLELKHLIGPNTEHKYEPETRKQVEEEVQKALLNPPAGYPLKVTFQTKTLAYSGLYWLEATGLEEHWKDSRIDGTLDAPVPAATKAELTTKNISSMRLRATGDENFGGSVAISIDGQNLQASGGGKEIVLSKTGGQWKVGPAADAQGLRKRPGLQGPIDDAFTAPFLYVLPDAPAATKEAGDWVAAEVAYQTDRWRYLMRGDLRSKKASEVTQEDIRQYNLILWGDPNSNAIIRTLIQRLPIQWTADRIAVGDKSVPAKGHVLSMIYPTPAGRYIVFNSGLTFRENHKSNAVQNPQLPDWAILDLSTPPDGQAAGKVVAADFFDERWQVRK